MTVQAVSADEKRHVPDPDNECAAFDRCADCAEPIDFRDGQWVTLRNSRTWCTGRVVRS